jgi:hypothetical protein
MPKRKIISLLERERFELSAKSGGGILQYEAWGYQEKEKTIVTRYNIAYINHAMFSGDNGRVLGYDNAHGYHHRHWMGTIEPFEFESYVSVVERFQSEWRDLVKRKKEKRL